ncbi:hypothetical protein GGQ88_001845 [Novosphingobium hassiacum]|uniref:Uncharacterized protein n=1 Tax=Novosphingobium hassiacum TaxID=173676 RepID=A0A7W5ZXY5_9SPHN|nr:hypothetical protein [Novosphingobium hassiacum]MBB3860579.1 hypothetical protein [Novosphingobium hassiacum]
MLLDVTAFETKSEATTTLPPRRLPPGERLLREVRELAGPLVELIEHRESPWASITFSGARHAIVMRFSGSDAVSDGERLIALLPDHEFRLRGKLVADASVVRVDHELLPAPLMEVECEILLLDED